MPIQMRNLHPQLQAAVRSGAFGQAYPTILPLYVDASHPAAGDDGPGTNPNSPFATIQAAIDAAEPEQTIYIAPKTIAAGATDPSNYAETLTIGIGLNGLRLIGYSNGVVQGAQPQISTGAASTTSPLLTIRSPGVLITGLSLIGDGCTGGGILLDELTSTATAFGFSAEDCMFTNIVGSGAAATGGAIFWTSNGGAWQLNMMENRLIDCRGGLVLPGTSSSRPTHVVVQYNHFGSTVNTTVDCDIYLAGGSGAQGVVIDSNVFATVDVPAYATSPTAARYVDLTGCEGIMSNNFFACISDGTSAKTFKAAGDAAKVPATVRMVGNYGEAADDSTHAGGIERVT